MAAMMSGADDRAPLYITTPIYYVNAAPHIGHAYTSVACDAACRFAKLDGRRAMLVTGTDEHGEKVEESALKEGIEPLEFATRVSSTFRELAESRGRSASKAWDGRGAVSSLPSTAFRLQVRRGF